MDFQSPQAQDERVGEILVQEHSLLSFARNHGLLANEWLAELAQTHPRIKQGSEHLVYLIPDERRVVKITREGRYGERFATPAEYLERLHWMNCLAEDVEVSVLGVLEIDEETPGIVTGMKYVDGVHPDAARLDALLRDLGWEPYSVPEVLAYRHVESGIIWKDTHPGNFKEWRGRLYPIDIVIDLPSARQAFGEA